MRVWTIVAGLSVAAVAVWLAMAWFQGGTPVQAVAVVRGPIQEFVDEQGQTRLPQTHLITMPFDGRIEPITLTEGASVSAGQVVARIVPKDLQLALDNARAAVERLAASIRENDYDEVEQTTLVQSMRYVESMDSTVAAARQRVRAGEAKLNFANLQFQRTEQLRRNNAVAADVFDAAQLRQIEADVDYQQDRLVLSALESIQAATVLVPTLVRQYMNKKPLTRAVLEQQQAQARLEMQQQQINLERGEMASPIDGVVLARRESNERLVPGGTVLLEIGDLGQMEVELEVLSQDVVRVRRGQEAEIYGPAIGATPLLGTVEKIYPAGFTKVSSLGVEQQRVKVIIAFQSDDLEHLRQQRNLGVGFRVRARIVTAASPQTLVVPRSALFRGPGGSWQVFAIRNRRARLLTVPVGLINDELAEITGQLTERDLVILAPESTLVDGQRVQPIIAPAADGS